jgi:hypothetical protein
MLTGISVVATWSGAPRAERHQLRVLNACGRNVPEQGLHAGARYHVVSVDRLTAGVHLFELIAQGAVVLNRTVVIGE